MADQQSSLNQLLQWSIQNSTTDPNSTPPSNQGLTAAALSELLGGPSDADLMLSSMQTLTSPSTPHSERQIAWDNFEQLIENLDNANNLSALKLWEPLLAQLASGTDAEDRRMAAWCVSTAVQNNVKSQEAMLAAGGVGVCVKVLREDSSADVRKKVVAALSSEVRNFQPGLEEMLAALPRELGGLQKGVDAGDMEAVDKVIGGLREFAVKGTTS